jgi:hypothetical protein
MIRYNNKPIYSYIFGCFNIFLVLYVFIISIFHYKTLDEKNQLKIYIYIYIVCTIIDIWNDYRILCKLIVNNTNLDVENFRYNTLNCIIYICTIINTIIGIKWLYIESVSLDKPNKELSYILLLIFITLISSIGQFCVMFFLHCLKWVEVQQITPPIIQITPPIIPPIIDISNLSQVKFDKLNEGELCLICYDEYKQDEKITLLSCKHIYHYDCINTWVQIDNSCPLCRKIVTSDLLTIEEIL